MLDALESCGIEVLPVCDCNEAPRMLETHPPAKVVVTETTLPDGDWQRVLEIVVQGCANIEIVVSLRLGDHPLWLDVLDQGGYDVLVEALPARGDTADCGGCRSQQSYAFPRPSNKP